MGIDPGLVRTGWGVVEGSGAGSSAGVLAYGIVAPPTGEELEARLVAGARELREVLATHRPELVALEEVYTAARHPKSALLMAHMRGVICLVVGEAGVPLVPLTATTVKQRITGNGRASKEQVQRMVFRLTGLDPTKALRWDVTDALALGLAGLHRLGPGSVHPALLAARRGR